MRLDIVCFVVWFICVCFYSLCCLLPSWQIKLNNNNHHHHHHISSGAQWKPVVQQQQPRRESLSSTAIFCPVTCSTPWPLRHSAPCRTRPTNSSPRSAGEHHCVQPIRVKRLSCISASQQQSNVLTRSACPTHSFPSPHSGHPDNSHTLLNVSHLGNEVPGSKIIIIIIIIRFVKRQNAKDFRGATPCPTKNDNFVLIDFQNSITTGKPASDFQ